MKILLKCTRPLLDLVLDLDLDLDQIPIMADDEDEEGDMLHPVEMVEKTETKSVILEDMEPSDLMEDFSGIRMSMIPDMQDTLVPIRVD